MHCRQWMCAYFLATIVCMSFMILHFGILLKQTNKNRSLCRMVDEQCSHSVGRDNTLHVTEPHAIHIRWLSASWKQHEIKTKRYLNSSRWCFGWENARKVIISNYAHLIKLMPKFQKKKHLPIAHRTMAKMCESQCVAFEILSLKRSKHKIERKSQWWILYLANE